MKIIRSDTIAHLTDPEWLRQLIGPVKKISIEPLSTVGFSGSSLQRIKLHLDKGASRELILKETKLKDDWLSQRSNDRIGREAKLLSEPCLSKIWDRIQCPYLAYANAKGSTGLLMEDYSAHLFPDNREPVDLRNENIIINTITAVHALYWDSAEIRQLSWLTQPHDYLNLLRPGEHEQDSYCPPPEPIRSHISQGWKVALDLLPAHIKNYLIQPVERVFEPWKNLPVTLIHGDLKIANMAITPTDQLVLFDWPMVGCAPCGMELGWYLAVNASRLARTKTEFINAYRSSLESHLHYTIDEKTWREMKNLAIVTGAMMMLWRKALNRQGGTQEGIEEWEWWANELEKAIGHK